MLTNEDPIIQPLTNGFTLRTVSTPEELDRVSALSGLIHEESAGEMSRKIFARHPAVTGRDLPYIEDEHGEVAATLCLIPWKMRFGPAVLTAAELGIVGTLERYRGQHLNHALMEYFWKRLAERGAQLSIIQGIPYFYRQYGYEYAQVPLEGGWRIQPDQIPAPVVGGYAVRPAAAADVPLLSRWYDEASARLNLSACRGEPVWEYLMERTAVPEAMQHDTFIVLSPAGEPVGYFRVADYHFYENLLTLDDSSALDFAAGVYVLNVLKQLAAERGKDGIRLYQPAQSSLIRLAVSFGAVDLGSYSWQISIPDRTAFLTQLIPLLEDRVAHSIFSGLSGEYSLNLYKEVIRLAFQDGRITSISSGKGGNTIMRLPPNQFVPLAMGGLSMDEIHASYPDASTMKPWKLLVETLFPRSSSFFSTIY